MHISCSGHQQSDKQEPNNQRWARPCRLLAAAMLLSAISTHSVADPQTTFRFQESDGTVWLTDHPPKGADFNRYRFLGYHGRKTATKSCRGVNKRILASRASAYRSTIRRYAADYGVSDKLIHAIITIESCFDRLAHSRAGAQGLMQLMPQTAATLGVTNSYNAEQNLRGGIKYFSQLQSRFNYNNKLALAAYNAGPGAVDKYQGIPPYPETQAYVSKVLKRFRASLAAN